MIDDDPGTSDRLDGRMAVRVSLARFTNERDGHGLVGLDAVFHHRAVTGFEHVER